MLGGLCALFIPAKTLLLVHWRGDVLDKGEFLLVMIIPVASAMRSMDDKRG
jgi:hypothetical protein